jgi:hypothetical protein
MTGQDNTSVPDPEVYGTDLESESKDLNPQIRNVSQDPDQIPNASLKQKLLEMPSIMLQ